ncbi:hypothetical protein SHIRM173S_07305 [Streptomyces hirsutus]
MRSGHEGPAVAQGGGDGPALPLHGGEGVAGGRAGGAAGRPDAEDGAPGAAGEVCVGHRDDALFRRFDGERTEFQDLPAVVAEGRLVRRRASGGSGRTRCTRRAPCRAPAAVRSRRRARGAAAAPGSPSGRRPRDRTGPCPCARTSRGSAGGVGSGRGAGRAGGGSRTRGGRGGSASVRRGPCTGLPLRRPCRTPCPPSRAGRGRRASRPGGSTPAVRTPWSGACGSAAGTGPR